jgi:hypothetical protein
MLSGESVVFIQQFQGVEKLTHKCRRGNRWLSQAAEMFLPMRRENREKLDISAKQAGL